MTQRYAYINRNDPFMESFKLLSSYYTENDISESEGIYPNLDIRDVPEPPVEVFDTVYTPTRFWYKKAFVREMEPIFSSSDQQFQGYICWVYGPGGEQFGIDSFKTPWQALMKSWFNKNAN